MLEATQSLPGIRAPAFPLQGCPVPAVLLAARLARCCAQPPRWQLPEMTSSHRGTEPLSPKVCQENPVLSKVRKLIFALFVSTLCAHSTGRNLVGRGVGTECGGSSNQPHPHLLQQVFYCLCCIHEKPKALRVEPSWDPAPECSDHSLPHVASVGSILSAGEMRLACLMSE